jgi:hypothetical protein
MVFGRFIEKEIIHACKLFAMFNLRCVLNTDEICRAIAAYEEALG